VELPAAVCGGRRGRLFKDKGGQCQLALSLLSLRPETGMVPSKCYHGSTSRTMRMPSRPSRDTPSGNYLLQVAAGAEAGCLRIKAASVNKVCRWQLAKILLNLLPGARLVPRG
jgi:hypothetical protein